MRTLMEIQEAEEHLLRLRREYEAEGAALDPREIRRQLDYWTQQIAIARNDIDALCNFAHDVNHELAKKHGIKEIPPF